MISDYLIFKYIDKYYIELIITLALVQTRFER